MELHVGLTGVVLAVSLLATTSPQEAAAADADLVQVSGVATATAAPEKSAARNASPRSSRGGRTNVLTVANANVREGSRARLRRDLDVGRDRRVFVDRLMKRVAHAPGVVVLQETYGTAKAYVRALNRHERAGASYRLVTRPQLRSAPPGSQRKRSVTLRVNLLWPPGDVCMVSLQTYREGETSTRTVRAAKGRWQGWTRKRVITSAAVGVTAAEWSLWWR